MPLEKESVAILLGNEAIARGAYEAGVAVATGYPGTPSTEVIEALAKMPDIWVQWSPNEKVALEVATGASFAGARTLVAMKHVGLNVAADPLLTFCYMPVKGGTVIVSAGDPGMFSSQNEQDNRHYGCMARIPVLAPSDSQEAKDFTIAAFDISEHFSTPVILFTTTRLSHGRSAVSLGKRTKPSRTLEFVPRIQDFVMVPANARKRHPIVEQRLDALREYAESCQFNKIELKDRDIGFVTGGIAYQYVKEAFPEASVLKLGLAYPLPKKLIADFASQVDRLFVVEEGDPFWEQEILSMGIEVIGQGLTGTAVFPRTGELSADIVRRAVEAHLGTEVSSEEEPQEALPLRPPTLCAGCPHRGVFYVLAKCRLNVTGDIGCYALGASPPFNSLHTCTCMGASIGEAMGLEKAMGREFSRRTVAVIGDSTFLHSGIAPLIDVVYNRGTVTVVILDNGTTAMTGHQDNPASGRDARGELAPRVDLEALVRACGVKDVSVVDPYDLEDTEMAIKGAVSREEPSVVIARRSCALISGTARPPVRFLSERCIKCGNCFRIGCPAMEKEDGRPRVNETLCNGCYMCVQLCKSGALAEQEA